MRFLRALLILMLALGASLPACAGTPGCEPATTTPAIHHQMAMPAPVVPRHDRADRHADACVGCAAELPETASLSSQTLPTAAKPVAHLLPSLASLSPGIDLPPPRNRA
jgi:hypothetical protein